MIEKRVMRSFVRKHMIDSMNRVLTDAYAAFLRKIAGKTFKNFRLQAIQVMSGATPHVPQSPRQSAP